MKGKGREKSRSFLIMGYIYKITNDVNDKVYIGQTHLTLTLACQGKCKTAKGFQWRYEDDDSPVKSTSRYTVHPIKRISKNGEVVRFESAKKASEQLNLNLNSIHRACNRGITYKNYFWEYEEIA